MPRNEFLCTTKTYGDFELKVKFKLLGDKDKANAGVQFRTKRIPKHHEVSGYQADIGQGYWGALYDESAAQQGARRAGGRATWRSSSSTTTGTSTSSAARGRASSSGSTARKTVDYTEKDDEGRDDRASSACRSTAAAKTKVLYKDITIEELPAPKK